MLNTIGQTSAFERPGAPSLDNRILRFEADGIMWIGDPHMTCVRPGRRLEDDFLQVPLDKIRQAREIAEEKNLLMVFLGDMVDNPTAMKAGTTKAVENTNLIISGFAKAMNFRPCITITGNHDKTEVRLTQGTTLATMRDLGLINVIEHGGPCAIITIGGKKIGLGGTPYGQEIPRDVRGVFGEPVDEIVWITHSQFEFDVKNNFLDKTFEIEGCSMVVNGHDHTTMKPRCEGQTWWFNPGNLTRMSVDCVDHKPSVWQWHPALERGQLIQHTLKFEPNAFDLRGLQVAADVKSAHQVEKERANSLFAELLVQDQGVELNRSEGGDILGEDIEQYINSTPGMSEAARDFLRNLHKRAPEKIKL